MKHTHAHGSSGSSTCAAPSRSGARAAFRVVLATLLLSVAMATLAGSASAVIVHLGNGHTISYQPTRGQARPQVFDELFSNLDYNGGPVMPSNTNYTIYWEGNASTYPTGYETGVNRYLEDLAADSGGNKNVDSVSTQYNDAEGQSASYSSHFGGARVDKESFPTSGCTRGSPCLTDAQLQSELKRYVEAHGLPINLETEYFLLLPPGVVTCFDAAGEECSAAAPRPFGVFCAYHSNAPAAGSQLIYSDDPYDGEGEALAGCARDPNPPHENFPNGISDTALEGGLSHEHNESITDPEPNSAWTDFGGTGGEIGDKCRTFSESTEFGAPLGEVEREGKKYKYNQVINGHHYWYQQEWSNQGSQCLQRFTLSGAEPTATFTVAPGPEGTATLDAAASTAPPEGVTAYNWQFNDGPGHSLNFPSETSEPTISHSFAEGGTYAVALTVFASNGTSTGTARTVSFPIAAITGPSAASAGETVAFNGASSVPPEHRSITGYRWDFGDGSGATGPAPSHAYAAPGTYEVTLEVTDSSGFTAIVAGHPVLVSTLGAGGAVGSGVSSSGGGGGGPAAALTPTLVAVPATGAVAVPASISVKANGRATAKLSCSGTAATCSGEIVLTMKRSEIVGSRKRTRTVTLGSFRFTIAAGRATNVTFTLKPAGRWLLRSAGGHLKVTETLHRTSPSPLLTNSRSARLSLVIHR